MERSNKFAARRTSRFPGSPAARQGKFTLVMLIAILGMMVIIGYLGNAGYIVGGLVTGAGVCAMHYTGMYAMYMSAKMVWKPAVVVSSVPRDVPACLKMIRLKSWTVSSARLS